ncbi:hypothetical protein COV81_01950 [Candidatus Peregrinibacteria bacterium CG11_big_fil_rev_8_21_14_0_20_41_10]|nr:MAG: hypothetical protein COV81_01950 [Candidatus Peregrinibacteria bacterium CG11_big_fil_rev_8_21_14_0_20_41_10]
MVQTTISNPAFADLQAKILNALGEDILSAKLDVPKLYALIELFKLAENEAQLQMLLHVSADETPGLKNLVEKGEALNKTTMEKEAHFVLSKLMNSDPKRAAAIAIELSKEGGSWSQLLANNPDLNNLID